MLPVTPMTVRAGPLLPPTRIRLPSGFSLGQSRFASASLTSATLFDPSVASAAVKVRPFVIGMRIVDK